MITEIIQNYLYKQYYYLDDIFGTSDLRSAHLCFKLKIIIEKYIVCAQEYNVSLPVVIKYLIACAIIKIPKLTFFILLIFFQFLLPPVNYL